MQQLRIEGGTALKGKMTLSGNKNAILPMIAASLLTDEEVVLHNVPDILDVKIMLEIAEDLGVGISWSDGTLKLQTSRIVNTNISRELSSKIRTSILFAGPLLARSGKVAIWPPGGDVIGRRRLDGHFYGLKCLGAAIDTEDIPFSLSTKGRMKGRELFLDEASVTATEQIILTAVLAEGRTTIHNAASEPHVCDLAIMLNEMGANISGIETKTIIIDGVDKLHGTEHSVINDHVEAGSFLALCAATGGEITIHGTTPRHFWMLRRIFERFSITMEIKPDTIHLPAGQELRVEPDFGNAIPTISDGPWPQYPTDMMSCTIVMATQARGTVLFFEKMFESRLYFVDRLISMGANAVVCDPHRVVISGPAKLRGIEMASPDIRAGMALLIAALCAKGQSIIHNTDVIYRGYENIVGKITDLGGKIH